MAYFGKKVNTKRTSNDHYGQSFDYHDDRSHTSKPRYPKVIQPIIQDNPVVGKDKILRPTNDLQIYLSAIKVIDRGRAKFVIVDEKNQPLMTFSGEFLYFVDKETAFHVQEQLKKRFDISTSVLYGPSHKKKGEFIR